jgi:stage III sporulation protein AB
MRTLIILLISLLPIFGGAYKYIRATNEIKILNEIIKLLLFLKEEIRFSLKEIKEIFEKVRNSQGFSEQIKDILAVAVEEKEYTALEKRLTQNQKLELRSEQISNLSSFLNGLGRSDLEGQLEHIAHFEKIFSLEKEKAEKEKEEKVRLWFGLSFSLGGAIFVLLI